MPIKFTVLLGAGFLLLACGSGNGGDPAPNSKSTCNTASVTYALTVAPLIQKNCIQCHNPNLANNGVDLSTYGQVRDIALNELLIGTTNHEPNYPAMPKNAAKLPDCDINKLRKWVADGAPNN